MHFFLTLGYSKKVKDELEKALAAFNKEIRHNQHKVHLLCLVARGLYLSRQCDDIVRQGLLLSVLGEKWIVCISYLSVHVDLIGVGEHENFPLLRLISPL